MRLSLFISDISAAGNGAYDNALRSFPLHHSYLHPALTQTSLFNLCLSRDYFGPRADYECRHSLYVFQSSRLAIGLSYSSAFAYLRHFWTFGCAFHAISNASRIASWTMYPVVCDQFSP